MEDSPDLKYMPDNTYGVFQKLKQLDLINATIQLIPNLSPVTYSETLVYVKDIEEKDMAFHLSPAEIVTKEQMAVGLQTKRTRIGQKLRETF